MHNRKGPIMVKTKKVLQKNFQLPRITQKTFVISALLAYVSNVLFWTTMWASVYPNGGRLSQFSVLAVGEVMMPILFFSIAYLINAHEPTRLSRVFKASMLAGMGLLIQVYIGVMYYWYILDVNYGYNEFTSSYWFMIVMASVALVCFALLAIFTRTRLRVAHTQLFQIAFLLLAGGVYIITASMRLTETVDLLLKTRDASTLLQHPHMLQQVVLPLIVFGVAYYVLRRVSSKFNHVYIAAVYAFIGVIVSNAIYSISVFSARLGASSALQNIDHFAIAPWMALLFSLGLIVWHRRYKK